jgi:hypothetical protein
VSGYSGGCLTGALIGALMVGVLGGIGLRSRSIYLVLSALTLGPLVLIFMADGRGYEPLVFLFLAGTAIVGLWLGAGLAALTVTCSPRLVPTDSGVRSDAMKRNIDNIPVSKRIPFRH